MGRCLLALACLAGCDKLFDLQHIDPLPPGEAGVDVRMIDTPPFICPPTYNLEVLGFSPAYRYEPMSTSWDVAEAKCEADSAGLHTHLIVLDDDPERTALLKALATSGIQMSVWIGFSDRKVESVFRWVTDEPVGIPPQQNPPWPPGQPDDLGGAQDCVRVQGTAGDPAPGLFDDKECGFFYPYVCECDGWPADPLNF